jgi:tetratricopeptide (TPR) repeat protein
MNRNELFKAAYEYYQKGDLPRAENICRTLLEEQPSDVRVLYFAGIIYYQLGDYDSSIGCLKKVTELDPSHADAYYNLANAFRKKTRFDDSISCYKKALNLNPALYEAYYNLGIVHLDRKRFAEAIGYFQKAVQLNPVLPDSFYSLGVAFQEKGDIDEAITCYRKAIQLAPNDAEAYDNLGTALHEKGEIQEAINSYQRALYINPNLAFSYYNLGILLQENGQPDEGMNYYQKALQLEPDLFKGNNRLDDLAIKYGTDKSSRIHNYTNIYFKYLNGLRDEELRIVEIGVALGRSLRMWKEFFPRADIVGVDIDPNCRRYADERVKIFIGDQSDEDFLESLARNTGGNFDLIIDDGGHLAQQQQASFKYLFPHLKPKGVYVIEDLLVSYRPDFRGSIKGPSTIEFLKNLVDEVNFKGRSAAGDPKKVISNPETIIKQLGEQELSYYERYVDSIHFYPGICFIFKRG